MKLLRSLRRRVRRDHDRATARKRLLGLALIAGGFVAIGLAWNGSAGQNWVPAQFPYLLSGGLAGLGSIVTGSTLLLLAAMGEDRRALLQRHDDLIRLLGRSLAQLQASSNGHASAPQVVVAGGGFHRPDCRLIEGASGLTTLGLEQATAEGLTPCRVCAPASLPQSGVTS